MLENKITATLSMAVAMQALRRILQPMTRMIRQMSIELKIKAKSLADEARTIRLEEKRAKALRRTSEVNNLHHHRIQIVRPEARATHLTRAFLRGMPYGKVEGPGTRTAPPVNRMARMVRRYGALEEPDQLEKILEDWIEAGQKKAAA